MNKLESFDPIENETATVLILGSMPGTESLRKQEYYANSRNRFWSIMGELLGAGPELDYADRVRTLKDSGIAVWDVLKFCEREGSLDSAIQDDTIEANDFRTFFKTHPHITHVFFNGMKAQTSYKRHVMPKLTDQHRNLTYTLLPSTSPAHAAMSVREKVQRWRSITGLITVNRDPQPMSLHEGFDMTEKWQEAINKWDTWAKSVMNTAALMRNEHHNLRELIDKSNKKHSKSLDGKFEIAMNEEATELWLIVLDIHARGRNFVSDKIGLEPEQWLHRVFSEYWTNAILREMTKSFGKDYILEADSIELLSHIANVISEKRKPVWPDSKTMRIGREIRIIDSISWERGKISREAVATELLNTKWESDSSVMRNGKGHRPIISRELVMDPEAIVCYILNKKVKGKKRLTQKELAIFFGKKIGKDSNRNPTSTTIRNRVKRGKYLIEGGGAY